jgi:putative toxin-antitoxin system antitoxin component (TIGR02293 family)
MAGEQKAQITLTGFEQIEQILRGMNDLLDEAKTGPKGLAAHERVQRDLTDRVKQALTTMYETLGKPKPLGGMTKIEVTRIDLSKVLKLLRLTSTGTLLDLHEQLSEGLEVRSVKHLIGNLSAIPKDEALAAFGVSWRTIERKARKKPLSPEQSGRVFKFAEVLAKATDVFGSQEQAEAWLSRPAVGLNQQRPIDLLTTAAGVELVESFLTRLDYGVYS